MSSYHVESHDRDHGSHRTLEAAIKHAEKLRTEIESQGNGDMVQVRAHHKSGQFRSQQIVWPKRGPLTQVRP